MDLGRKITDLEKMENVPNGTSYLAEAGDGSGTKQIEHEKLVKKIGEDLKLGNLAELDTKSKESVVKAVNEVNKKAGTTFEGTDGIKAGTAGVVPQPQPEDAGKVLGANGQWVPPGEAGSLDVLKTMEELEANTDKGKLPDALLVKEVNNKFGSVTRLITDEESGKLIGYTTKEGADTVFPFIRSSVSDGMVYFKKGGSVDFSEIITEYLSKKVSDFNASNFKAVLSQGNLSTLSVNDGSSSTYSPATITLSLTYKDGKVTASIPAKTATNKSDYNHGIMAKSTDISVFGIVFDPSDKPFA